MAPKNLLVYHENKRELLNLSEFLTGNGFKITVADGSEDVLGIIEKSHPDLILLSTNSTKLNEIEFCHYLKSEKATEDTFVVLLSNKKEEEKLISALEAGADDFIYEPVTHRVLFSRLKAILKRKKWSSNKDYHGEFVIDKDRYLIFRNGAEYILPKKEFQILSLLNSKPEKVFTRDEIKNTLWENFEKVRGRTIDVHIRKIREKIGEDIITTVKGVGYRLDVAS